MDHHMGAFIVCANSLKRRNRAGLRRGGEKTHDLSRTIEFILSVFSL